jgi:hypothetical protein
LSQLDLDFELETTGFEVSEIDLRIQSLGAERGEDDKADAMPSTGPPVSRSGDLWLLGRHKVFCANAFAQAAYATVMGRNRAIMVFADPPYNVPIAGNVSGLGAIQHREFAMGSGEMS